MTTARSALLPAPALTDLPHRRVDEAFEACVAAFPDRTALACGSRTLTYSALDAAATRIAARLAEAGAAEGSVVALLAPRSVEAVAAILGVLKAGAAYLPLDPADPPELLKLVSSDSGAAVAVVHASLATAPAAEGLRGRPRLLLDPDCGLSDLMEPQTAAPCGAGRADGLAYIMYTSGSAGRPKGVMIPHRGILRLVCGCDFVELGPDEVLLQLAPLSFDASTFEIWGALLNGGTLAIAPPGRPSLADIAEAVHRRRVTTLWLTAGLFNLMVELGLDGLAGLRQLVVGGDVLSPSHVARALRALPGCRVVNGYGPTENTTFTCCYTVPRDFDPSGPVPIGRPVRGTTVRVLDEAMAETADLEEGELFAGGEGLALGYVGLPELTAERFVPDPRDPGAKLYRTGDRVRRRADGDLEFVGRSDRQVKIDGKRVELDEIERVLRRVENVREAAVVCHADAAGRRVAAAFVASERPGVLREADIRHFLRGLLPDHMVPGSIRVLDALPLTANGKVDRARLAAMPPPRTETASPPVAEGPTIAALQAIFGRILGRDDIPAGANFFDLGATSLHLMEAHAAMSRALAAPVALVDLFARPTIGQLAACVDGAAAGMPAAHAAEQALRRGAALARAHAAGARRVRA